jgi:hypothetical protein
MRLRYEFGILGTKSHREITSIMAQNFSLTPEEHKVAEQYLNKLERNAANGKKKRGFLVFVLIVCSIQGIYYEYCWRKNVLSDNSFVERLKQDEIPDGVLPKYWFVGETRRTAALLEAMFHKHSIALIDGVMGIILLLIAVFGWVFLYNHWNDYQRDALIAKILRAKYEDFKLAMNLHSP